MKTQSVQRSQNDQNNGNARQGHEMCSFLESRTEKLIEPHTYVLQRFS